MTSEFLEGLFLKRYKRFFADVLVNGNKVVAHVPNTGRMKGLIESEAPCYLTYNDSPTRKLKYTLEALKTPSSWVGVNTARPNALVRDVFENYRNSVEGWSYFKQWQNEVKIHAQTRLDFCLSNDKDERLYGEIKNVTLAKGSTALFPDAVTERGRKHILELVELIRAGNKAELIFVIQREDCDLFQPAIEIDPEYALTLKRASQDGLVIRAFAFDIKKTGVVFNPSRKIRIQI